MKKTALRPFAILLFTLGALVGLALSVSATWADVESVFYGFNRYGKEMTSAMHCPILLDSDEIGIVRVTFRNSSEQEIRPTIRFQASNNGVFRTETEHFALAPGQKEDLTWTVSAEDIVLDRLIFAKIFTFASYPQKDVEQTCGILVLPLPGLSGKQAVLVAVLVSLAGMGAGIALWAVANKPLIGRAQDAMRALQTLAITVVVGLVSVVFAWWLLGVLTAALSLILTGVILGNMINSGKT